MNDVQYYKVMAENELAGLFQSDSAELAAVEITKRRIAQPELVVVNITGDEYYELLDQVMPETHTW